MTNLWILLIFLHKFPFDEPLCFKSSIILLTNLISLQTSWGIAEDFFEASANASKNIDKILLGISVIGKSIKKICYYLYEFM